MEIVSDVNDTLLLITEGVANDTDDNSTFTFRGSNVGELRVWQGERLGVGQKDEVGGVRVDSGQKH